LYNKLTNMYLNYKLPSPICHLHPSTKTCLDFEMPRHTKLGFLPSLESIKEEWGKYLSLKILATKIPGLFNRFHSCFAIVVMLKLWKSWNPSPPSSLGVCHFLLSQPSNTFIIISATPPKRVDYSLSITSNK
jgi:hypothetical protein